MGALLRNQASENFGQGAELEMKSRKSIVLMIATLFLLSDAFAGLKRGKRSTRTTSGSSTQGPTSGSGVNTPASGGNDRQECSDDYNFVNR